jgi:uncharacterized membrane protein YedE/YeeE
MCTSNGKREFIIIIIFIIIILIFTNHLKSINVLAEELELPHQLRYLGLAKTAS